MSMYTIKNGIEYEEKCTLQHTKKEYKKSIEQLKKALNVNPQFVEAYFNKGNSHAMLEELQDALAAYNKAVELNPKYTDAYVELSAIQSKLYLLENKQDKAVEQLEKEKEEEVS